MTQAWGYHYTLDIGGCDPDLIRSKNNVEAFAKVLVDKIDMVAYGEPQVIHFGDGDKEGFTLVQLIETSNITGHFCNSTNTAYLDVFSCKDFDPKTVNEVAKQFFMYKTSVERFTERNALVI